MGAWSMPNQKVDLQLESVVIWRIVEFSKSGEVGYVARKQCRRELGAKLVCASLADRQTFDETGSEREGRAKLRGTYACC